mmetsp:Transcript_10324/g.29606  ORF Transcript_10324/g.29606 Transcript_10324/m.29606 type:complete len:214 (+) Transcript_10324:5356-5997(+)
MTSQTQALKHISLLLSRSSRLKIRACPENTATQSRRINTPSVLVLPSPSLLPRTLPRYRFLSHLDRCDRTPSGVNTSTVPCYSRLPWPPRSKLSSNSRRPWRTVLRFQQSQSNTSSSPPLVPRHLSPLPLLLLLSASQTFSIAARTAAVLTPSSTPQSSCVLLGELLLPRVLQRRRVLTQLRCTVGISSRLTRFGWPTSQQIAKTSRSRNTSR